MKDFNGVELNIGNKTVDFKHLLFYFMHINNLKQTIY